LNDIEEVVIFKRSVSHIIGVAEWSTFSLFVDENKVEFRLDDNPLPFLEWKSPNDDFPLFSPGQVSFGSENGNLLGLNFQPEGDLFKSIVGLY